MSSSLTETNLEKKFQSVTNTQDSIQTLSLWLLHHKAHHQKIVSSWIKVLKKAKVSHRLTLFYLANDVIQNSKRKGVPFFKESFAEVLREATLLVRDEQIRQSVNRVFNIWSERSIYDSDFIAGLQGILVNAKVPVSAPLKLLAEFKCEKVIEKLRTVAKLEAETATKMATINISKLNATNAEIVQKLKDRTHGQQFSCEFDESAHSLEELIKAFNKEIQERNELILLLEQSEIYYDTQRGEAKIVANAYKNFAARVKALQKKLEELSSTFPSPLPSPCPDAPSPTNSDLETELELPADKVTAVVDKNARVALPQSSSPLASVAATFQPSVMTAIGNPIPTLSNLFTQEQSKMTSWLDTFSKTSVAPTATTASSGGTNDASSLDSRLSSLLQNIPNLPSGLQDTLLGSSISESATNSPASFRKSGNTGGLSAGDAATPIKDECSGQNTPLQDEDTPTVSTASFFSRLASAPKASQSPKEILKGLTNLIQTASAATKEKAYKPLESDNSHWPMETAEPQENSSKADTFSNKISASHGNLAETSLPKPAFFTSPQVTESENSRSALVPLSNAILPSMHSQISYSSSESIASQNIHENLSFIPTLVPSTPTGSHFKFQTEKNFAEYDPSVLEFKLNMDGGNVGEMSMPTPISEQQSHSPPSAEEKDNSSLENSVATNINAQRQSTLITLVTDNVSTEHTEKSDHPVLLPPNTCFQDTQTVWPIVPSQVTSSDTTVTVPNSSAIGNGGQLGPFFSTCTMGTAPNLVPDTQKCADVWQHSKIETVQSLRTANESRWFGSDWPGCEREEGTHGDFFPNDIKPYSRRPVEYRNYHHKSSQPPFPARNNWRQRGRPFPSNFSRGQMQKPFVPPLFSRGRGRRRFPAPY